MNILDTFNLISSVASLILSVIAIWLSLYFYNESKKSETNTSITLESIKTQSLMLERLTSRWMDRFTKYVTSPHQADETTNQLVQLITMTQQHTLTATLPSPEESRQKAQLITELISSYVAIFYYAGVSNIANQYHLPVQIENLSNADGIKKIVDQSYADYIYLKGILEGIDQQSIAQSSLNHLYIQALAWEPHIIDTATVYSRRSTDQTNISPTPDSTQ